jgi:hypothetical protein
MKQYLEPKIIFVLFLMVLSSCGLANESSPTVSPISDSTPTTSQIVSQPSTRSLPTPTIFPTMTFVPALPTDDVEAGLLGTLRDNGKCTFPCFWSFVPGITGIQAIWSSLFQFQNLPLNDVLIRDTGGGMGLRFMRDDMFLETYITVEGQHDTRPDVVRYIKVDFTVYRELEGDIGFVHDSPYYAQYFQYYTLSNLLSTYGPPDNVYVSYEDEQYTYEYYLFLDYTEQGWVALLTMPLHWQGDFDVLIGCPNEAFTTLWLWSPDDTETAREFGFVNYRGPLRSLEETSSLTIDEFLQRFRDPANVECLETPRVNLGP